MKPNIIPLAYPPTAPGRHQYEADVLQIDGLYDPNNEIRVRCEASATRVYRTSQGAEKRLCSVHYAFAAGEWDDEAQERYEAMWVKIFRQALQEQEQEVGQAV